MAQTPYAELHCHSNFSFLDGASPVEDLVERALQLDLRGLAITDHQGLYGVVRFASAAQEAGLRPIIGIEVELLDAAVDDPSGVVIPRRRPTRRGRAAEVKGGRMPPGASLAAASGGSPARPRPERARLPGHRAFVKEDLRGIGERQRGPHLVLLARDATGYRSLCRLVSRANLAGTKRVPRFSQALLVEHTEGLVALSGCREGEIARRLRVGDREGANVVAQRYATMFASGNGDSVANAGFFLELSHHLLPDDDWLVAETAALAADLGLPVVTTNDVHYARPEDRELQDVVGAIFHGRTLDTLGDLRRPDGESHLKSGEDLLALPPGEAAFARADSATARAWAEGIANSVELAGSCTVDLGFEQYRFPGFPVPAGETAFSYLVELCQTGARRRYHPLTAAVVKRLAHELGVIERAGLAEFFLICWDLMRFAKEQGIPAQGRGSATSSIVSYTLGISRVEPIAHNLLFERFINEGRTTYPDVDIDFSSERREEVIQYVYGRYGPEHTGMVCNLVTYRARSAVREVGYALGFPRPLVDRVAKALETYDSVMVRRDLETDGGFAEFFRRPGEGGASARAGDAVREAAGEAEAYGLVDGMGQLNKRVPLVGKVPPWRQPQKPVDPAAPRPFAWLAVEDAANPTGLMAARPEGPAAGGAVGPAVSFEVGAVTDATAPGAGTGQGANADLALGPGPSASGMWEEAPESPPAIRPGGTSDDEGGPGDSPASVAWLRAGKGTGYGRGPRTAWTAPAVDPPRSEAEPRDAIGPRIPWQPPGTVDGRGSTRSRAPWSRRAGRRIASAGRARGTRPRRRRTEWGEVAPSAAPWPASSPSCHPSPSADPRSASATGSAGSSSALASMVSRATSASTRAGCS